jgi:endonuclease YncB( thermonuclease family)
MAKTIEQRGALIVGHVGLGVRGAGIGSIRQEVHDGDTLNVRALGNFGIRFLGVDAPEISLPLPGADPDRFIGLADPRWDPALLQALTGPFGQALDPALRAHLQAAVTPGVALNHHRHAAGAEDGLEQLIGDDVTTLGHTEESFQFFLVFAHEIMDRYGRLLCYINRDQPQSRAALPRPRSYNERLLERGLTAPYFIWPNINPFRRQASLRAAVPLPGTANQLASQDPALRDARQWVAAARAHGIGIFDAADPLRLQSFELRFLSRQQPPDRWVIDLSQNGTQLLPPQQYCTIPNIEDRLYIPDEYVPLFRAAGWQ